MENVRETLKDWQRAVEIVRLMPDSTAPEISRLLGKPSNSALYFAMQKGLLTKRRRKDRTKRFPNIGSWVYSVKSNQELDA